MKIFTDGSKDPGSGKTGAVIFVADENLQFSIRLSDNLSVFQLNCWQFQKL